MKRVIEHYKNLLTDSKAWLMRGFVIFLVFGAVGAFVGTSNPSFMDEIGTALEEELGESPTDNILAKNIFAQNLTVAAIALGGGIILGLAPFFMLAVNGFILGYVLAAVSATIEASYFVKVITIFLAIAPHGLFELPAFFLAGGLGLQLGLRYLSKKNRGQRTAVFKQDFKTALYAAPVIFVLLVIAAVVEVFVTGKLFGE